MTQQMQIGDTVRDMTADEIANYKTTIAEAQTLFEARIAKQVARQAVLDKLGLTTDEAQALLG
jgi:antitoxin component of RelBE/YafQ-DinJ toxin-antitoxin module